MLRPVNNTCCAGSLSTANTPLATATAEAICWPVAFDTLAATHERKVISGADPNILRGRNPGTVSMPAVWCALEALPIPLPPAHLSYTPCQHLGTWVYVPWVYTSTHVFTMAARSLPYWLHSSFFLALLFLSVQCRLCILCRPVSKLNERVNTEGRERGGELGNRYQVYMHTRSTLTAASSSVA